MDDNNKDDYSADATLDLCVEVSPKPSREPSPETYSSHDSKDATSETTTQGNNKDSRESLHEMHLSESFFVSDTLDDESLIIPPTPCEAGTDIGGRSPGNDSSSIIAETQEMLGEENEQSPKKDDLLFDADEEDEWTKPTQPLFPMKQEEEQQIIGPSDGEEENDETFVGTESILGSCYDLPTQPMSMPKEQENPVVEGGDDDWNLQLIESQATQSPQSLATSGNQAKSADTIEIECSSDKNLAQENLETKEFSTEQTLMEENAEAKEAPVVEEVTKATENGIHDVSEDNVDAVSTNNLESKDEVEAVPEHKREDEEEEDERDRTPSPSKFRKKESTPEDVGLFAEIESLVNAARAENKSGLNKSSPAEHNNVTDPVNRNSISEDSDQDEIAPSPTSRSVDGSRDNVTIVSVMASPLKNDTSEKATDESSESIKAPDIKESTPVTSKSSPVKKSNRLKKKTPKNQVSEQVDETESSGEEKNQLTSDDGSEKKSPQHLKSPSTSPKKKTSAITKTKQSETLNLEESESLRGASEIADKPPSQPSSSEVLGPPTFRTPLQKKVRVGPKAEKRVYFGDFSGIIRRSVGKFATPKSLQKCLHSVGIEMEEQKLKVIFNKNKKCTDEEFMKRKVIHRVYCKDNELFEELVPFDDIHSRSEISPIPSSLSSGEMGDISSISSKSNSSGDIKSSQEDTLKSFKGSQTSDAIPFPPAAATEKSISGPTTFSDKVASQDDFKNPMVVISPIKSGKRTGAKKTLSDSPKPKKMRKLPIKKEEILSTESSDIDDGKKGGPQLSTPRSSKSTDGKRKGRAESKRRNKKGARQNELSAIGGENQDVANDVPEVENVPELEIDEETMNDPSPFGEILPGVRVMARWKDGYYYPGVVKRQEVDGRWEVMFEDGAMRTVIQDSLLKIPVLQAGTNVLAMSPDGYFDPGIVVSCYREGKEAGYVIEQYNGVTRRYKRASVILSTEQAKQIINKRPVAPPSLTINLDNIVGGKRKRSSSTHQQESSSSPPPPKTSRPSRRKKPDSNLDSSEPSQSSTPEAVVVSIDKKDSLTNEPAENVPVVTNKKKGKGTTKANKGQGKRGPKKKADKASDKPSSVNSEPRIPDVTDVEPTTSTGQTRRDGASIRSSRMFVNFAFLLTYSTKKIESEDGEEYVSFEKQHLCQLILGHGGTIYDTFEEAQKCVKKKVLLLASTYVRTIKYLQCVAANIPCIQHSWIQTCINTGLIVEFIGYRLPTGLSLIRGIAIDWHFRNNIFSDMKIVITADKKMGKEFVNLWTPVLLAAKAELVQKWILPSLMVPGTSFGVDLIVTNHTCPSNILEAARKRKIPVVSSEYIIQCIIEGVVLPHDGHEKFRHDFQP